ncbi:MAG: hypothetical protein ACI9CE_003634 [Flavobacterium sp.]|jgi:hypothetical protein
MSIDSKKVMANFDDSTIPYVSLRTRTEPPLKSSARWLTSRPEK